MAMSAPLWCLLNGSEKLGPSGVYMPSLAGQSSMSVSPGHIA